MRTWERVSYQERCGLCGTLLTANTPIQTISRHGLKRKLIRCANCADGLVPPDLPDRPALLSVQEQVARMAMNSLQSVIPTRTRGALKRMAQEADTPRERMRFKENREPGEEG